MDKVGGHINMQGDGHTGGDILCVREVLYHTKSNQTRQALHAPRTHLTNRRSTCVRDDFCR